MGERDHRGKPAVGRDAAGRVAPASERSDEQTPALADPPPSLPRTATLDDPLTTSLLAEVARRSKTIEVSPEQIDEAVDAASAITDPTDDPRKRTQR